MIQDSDPNLYDNTIQSDHISFLDIFLVLVKNIKLIIILPTVFCIIAIIYVLNFTSPTFVSSSSFMSSVSSEGSASGMIGFAAQFGLSSSSSNSTPQWSYIDVIKSRTLAKKLLNYKFDTKKYGINKSLLEIQSSGNLGIKGIDTLIVRAVQSVQGMIDIKPFGKNMYNLKVSSFEPQLSADISFAVIQELENYLKEYNNKNAIKTRQFIEERLMEIESELEDAEESLKDFREKNRSILGSPKLQMEQERIKRDVKALIGVFTTLKQELETAKIDEVKDSDYVIILDKPNIPLYPFGPRKKMIVIFVGFFSIGVGVLLSFIKEFTMGGVQNQIKIDQLNKLIKQNILFFIPFRK